MTMTTLKLIGEFLIGIETLKLIWELWNE